MAGGKLVTTGATFYRRGVPNSFTGFGLLTTINYSVANVKQNNLFANSLLQYSKNNNTNNKKK
jgi:hypothetical protein